MRKKVLISLGIALIFLLIPVLLFQYAIRQNPRNQFTLEGIKSILSKESVVYYSNEEDRVGTFFQGLHREYIPYSSIPPLLIDAVVSAEDKNFFTHNGIDYRGLLYAMLDNIRSFSLKRGGSSLTQQTAKNIFPTHGFGTWNRLKAKLPELINTFRLERNFSKKEILEFYLNQFYVAGNGHGMAIAARYFFNKNIKNLNLLEIAFIAGSVKGPNQYNPFIAKSKKDKKQKKEKAYWRVQYVLKKLLENKKITQASYDSATAKPIPFKRGTFRFQLSTNMVKVKKTLNTSFFQNLLHEYGIDSYESSGLKIYTTLDKDIQAAAEYATNKNLSTLNIIMNG